MAAVDPSPALAATPSSDAADARNRRPDHGHGHGHGQPHRQPDSNEALHQMLPRRSGTRKWRAGKRSASLFHPRITVAVVILGTEAVPWDRNVAWTTQK